MSSHQIHLYTSAMAINTQCVRIALEEARAKYTLYTIDPQKKPSWYFKINPLGKFPSMAYGGPPTSPDKPSPESAKLSESLVLVEFVADLFPDSGLRPSHPVKLARSRFFWVFFDNNVLDAFRAFLFGTGTPEALIEKLGELQALLPPAEEEKIHGGPFVVGRWSLGDAGVAPFLVRLPVILEWGLGKYTIAEGRKMLDGLKSPSLARLMKYIADASARPSVRNTWDGEEMVQHYRNFLGFHCS